MVTALKNWNDIVMVVEKAGLIPACSLTGIDHGQGFVPAHERGHVQGCDQVHVHAMPHRLTPRSSRSLRSLAPV
jgi:hypothetical protein